jgi:hypothetical protein
MLPGQRLLYTEIVSALLDHMHGGNEPPCTKALQYQPTTIYAHPLGTVRGSEPLNEGHVKALLPIITLSQGKNQGPAAKVQIPVR